MERASGSRAARSLVSLAVGAAAAFALSACGAAPRVEHAATTCNTTGSSDVQLADAGRSVTIDGSPTPGGAGAPMATVQCILKLLEVSDDVLDGITSTTGGDGAHEGDWDGLHATWSVSPIDGMRITITDTR